MDIFESLENLAVSEECFDDVLRIVEEYINELKNSTIEKTLDAHWDRITNNKARGKDNPEDTEKYFKSTDRAEERARKKGQALSRTDKGKHIHSKLAFDNGVLHYVRANESLYNEILDIVEELLNESNRARKYGQKNLTPDSKSVDIHGTKALKDSTQMNPERSSINLINRARSYDIGSVPHEGDHDKRYDTLDDPDTKKAFKNKEAIQGAIKSLKQADSDIAYKSLRNLKDEARELSRRKDPEENVDVLSKNRSYGGFKPNAPKDNYKNVMNSLRSNYGYNRLEKEIKRKNK